MAAAGLLAVTHGWAAEKKAATGEPDYTRGETLPGHRSGKANRNFWSLGPTGAFAYIWAGNNGTRDTRMFHVKDAEFVPDGRSGVYGGYQAWIDRPGRFRSLGDGQVDFSGIFSRLAKYAYTGWAVLEWECCLKHPEDGAREGAPFIARHIIRTTDRAFDDFAGGGADEDTNRRILGLE